LALNSWRLARHRFANLNNNGAIHPATVCEHSRPHRLPPLRKPSKQNAGTAITALGALLGKDAPPTPPPKARFHPRVSRQRAQLPLQIAAVDWPRLFDEMGCGCCFHHGGDLREAIYRGYLQRSWAR